MHDAKSFRRALLLTTSVALLLAVAAMAANQGLSADGAEGGHLVAPALPDLFYYLLGAIELLGLVFMVVLFGLARRRKDDDHLERFQPRAPWWSKALALLVVAALVATVLTLLRTSADRSAPPDRGAPTVSEQPTRPQIDSENPQDRRSSRLLGTAVTVVLFVALMAFALGALVLFRADRPAPPARELHDEIVRQVDAGLVDLETIADARTAIIASYARMQRLLASAGVERRASDAPLEFLRRALGRERLPGDSIAQLTDLFARAKFSHHEVDESMRAAALAALRDVRSAAPEAS